VIVDTSSSKKFPVERPVFEKILKRHAFCLRMATSEGQSLNYSTPPLWDCPPGLAANEAQLISDLRRMSELSLNFSKLCKKQCLAIEKY
jgi:hypothetical protein